MSSQNYPALVLNADFRPLCYFPLSLWSWQDAVKAVFLSRVKVVSAYEKVVCSPSIEIELPSVISLHDYVKIDRQPAFTRFNVFLRDTFTCQYCSNAFSSENLTFDHVVPRSRGGHTLWDNVVTACSPCNLKKGNQSLEGANMRLFEKPVQPSNFQLQKNGRLFPPNFLHESWRDFLYWDAELEHP